MIGTVDLVRGSGAALFAMSPLTGGVLRDEVHRVDPGALSLLRAHWDEKDPRIPASLHLPVGEAMFESRIMDVGDWRRSEYYNEFARPNDYPYILAYWLHKSAEKVVALSIQSSNARGPFDEGDEHRISDIIPHIRRAVEIRDRLEATNIRVQNFSACLDRVTFGVMVLDGDGRILEANSLAEQLLRSEKVIRREPDKALWLHGHAGHELRRWIVTGTPSSDYTQGMLHVQRADGRAPISVLVTPIPDAPVSWVASNPRWLVLLFDPERRIQPAAEMLCADLGLTAKEAELVALLSVATDLEPAALRMGIKVSTARTHLKSIFAKTGIRSQAELVQRALTGAAAYAPRK